MTTGYDRKNTRRIRVGEVFIGGGAPVTVQSMTNTDTRDVAATIDQIRRLPDVISSGLRCPTMKLPKQ